MQEFIEDGKMPIKAWVDGVQLEEAAFKQLKNIAGLPFIHKHIAVMPDVHLGMGAKSFIVRGKGNRESFCSCSHGAGRKMSRAEAIRTFTLEDHAKATAGVEMATDDSKPESRRGWQAQYQPRCDCCGRFVVPGAEGGSWVMVPATDCNAGDERERCAACTAKYGMAHCGPGYVEHLCCGMNKPANHGHKGQPKAVQRKRP